jgi:hypothetical protein
MENEKPMPEGARRAAEHIAQLIEIMKHQSERIANLEAHVINLRERQDRTEDSYLKLVEILKKSVVKIDEPTLGLN